MPVYQYACTECGEELEARQSFTDDALTVCPTCNGRLRKVLTAVGVVFKGSGFYRNDSRTSSSGDSGSASPSGDKTGAGKEAVKTAAKAGDSASPGSDSGTGDKSKSSGSGSSNGSGTGSASGTNPVAGSKRATAAAR